jgi:hypothetical protein
MSDPNIEFAPWTPPGFWSCAKDAPIGALFGALGIPETFSVELSARDWDDEARVLGELAHAFSFPDDFGRNGYAASDCRSDVRDRRPRFLAVLREIPASGDARSNVARAAQTIGAEDREVRGHCVVLEAGDSREIRVAGGLRSEIFPVWPLKTS